jgi:cardiolipin synthase
MFYKKHPADTYYQRTFKYLYARCAAALARGMAALARSDKLPDVERELAGRVQKVEFETAHGPVPAAKTAAILDKLKGDAGASDILQKHLAYEQAFNNGSPLVLGNKLVLLQDGPATYRAMFAAMLAAKNHINLEVYIVDDDEIGKQFADVLLEKRAQGVQVNLIYDSFGCLTTSVYFFDRLRNAGINVLEFNPINPLATGRKRWSLYNRDHRKLLVIDGRIAFVGGINISKVYSSNPFSRNSKKKRGKIAGWRNIHTQIEGPVVAEFQKLFLDTWYRQQGPPIAQGDYFPRLTTQGDEIVRAIGNTANDPQSPIYLTLMSAISHAEQEIHMTIAYFAPDPQLLKALKDAVRRGVKVKLVLPSHSDSWTVIHLGHSYYTELLRAGVQIYERREAVMHSKTACIDGVWSTIGSTNLDWRSFLHNDEINAVILGRDFAWQMRAMFNSDLNEADLITLHRWRRRSLLSRLMERLARLVTYWF